MTIQFSRQTMAALSTSLPARRLDSANQTLIELKSHLQAGQSRSESGQTIKKIEVLPSPGTASLVYAGYPYDPYA